MLIRIHEAWRDPKEQLLHSLTRSYADRAAGKFAAACREIAGARDILQKFENLKKQDE